MKQITERYGGKTYQLFKSGETYGVCGLSEGEAKDIARRLKKKGWSIRIELNTKYMG